MFIVFIGVFLLVIGLAMRKSPSSYKLALPVRIVGLLLIAIGVLTSFIKQIEAGEIGVTKLFGKVNRDVLSPGLHFVNPLMEVISMDVKTLNYTMSQTHEEGTNVSDDPIRALTSDGLEVIIDVTVLYRLNPVEAPKVLQEIGVDYLNTIIRPVARTKIRDNAVYYDAISLYSTKRDEFQQKIFNSIESNFNKRGFILEQLLIRNIALPPSVKASIEAKINAEQDAQKMEFVLQKEKQEAERKRVEAQGISDYHKIVNEGLSPKQLQYETIKMQKELASSPNTKIIFMGGTGGKDIPFILSDK